MKSTKSARLTRRGFLQTIGAAAAGAAVTGSATDRGAASSAPSESAAAEHQWAFVIDLRRCDGCEECTVACQKTHYLSPGQTWIKVYRLTGAHGQAYFMPRLCMHCENAPCVRVCPVAATFKNAEGVVLVDQNTCIGCRTCMAACPYEARYFNWDPPPPALNLHEQPMPEFPVPQQQGTVGKCILCVHNANVGKLPVCVEACAMGALYIADLERDVATNGRETVKLSRFVRENDAVRFREELGTRPRVWYIGGHGQRLGL
ncbi:MAG: 4Fe-4S dicluster domain-containing protein [Chloroflexi bacterium]|nr:4Fe-4S dicluster domain-containing protein [Chloroflexota bacterium]